MRLSVLLLAILAILPAWSADMLATFTLRDHLHHGWPTQLVHFGVEGLPAGAVTPANAVILGEDNAPRVCQWSDVQRHPDGSIRAGNVWFLTDLPADGTRIYRLTTGTPAAAVGMLHSVAGVIELDNGPGRIAVRLPDFNAAVLRTPEMPAKLSFFAPPIQAIRLPDGKWAGKGWLVGDVPIESAETKITAAGPLFGEVVTTYHAANNKSYTVKVRVEAENPTVLITEQFNLPAAQDCAFSEEQAEPSAGGKIPLFCFSLSEGLNPDTARYRGYAATPARRTIQAPDANREGAYTLTFAKPERQWSILGWFSWWPDSGAYYTAYRAADGDNGPVLGAMRMFSGRWFNPTGVQVWGDPKQGLYLAAPLGITHRRTWAVDGVHDPELDTDIYSGSLDVDVPIDTGKRCWALYAGVKGQALAKDGNLLAAGPNRAMIEHGEWTLDKIKDWPLAWENTQPVARPRLHTAPERAAEIVAATKAFPQTDDVLKGQHGFVQELLDGNGTLSRGMHFFPATINARGSVLNADYALANPAITPAQAQEIRSLLAFQAMTLADRDFYPVGAGFHLGNPNMALSLNACLTLIGCEIPDHPRAARWAAQGMLKMTTAFDKYIDPVSGAWNECPHYMYDASLYQMFEGMFALRYSGYGDLFDRPSVKRLLNYAMGTMPPPDARFGARIIPTEGNTSLEGCTMLGWAAAAYANTDPDLSARLQWMWQEDGKLTSYSGSREIIRPELPAKAPDCHSSWYRGFGAILRNGFPDPNETYMAYRQGQWVSHFEDGDQGSWHLYAKGAPLSLDFGSQYGPTMERPWLHNRVSIDHKMDPMLQHQHDIDTFHTLAAADFVSGHAGIDTLYPMTETPYHPMETLPNAAVSPAEPIPPLDWRRSILFVKDQDLLGPNYFVVRDTFTGATKPTDWSAWCLATGVQFDGNVARFTGQCGVDLDVAALTPAQATWVQNRDAIPPPPTVAKLSYGPGVPGWPKEYAEPAQAHPPIMAHNFMYLGDLWKKVNGKKVFEERQICARLTQPVGNGYFVILYPRKADGEPVPTYAAWAAGLGAKLTLPGTTHYVLLAPSLTTVKDGDLALEASVAVIRRYKDRVLLSLLQGRRLRAGAVEVIATAPVSVEVTAKSAVGETNGGAQTLTLTLPFEGRISVDGAPAGQTRQRTATITVPAGAHRFRVE